MAMDNLTDWHCEVLLGKVIEAEYRGEHVRGKVVSYGSDWFVIEVEVRPHVDKSYRLRLECEEIRDMKVEGVTL